MKVLIVDDDRVSRMLLGHIIAREFGGAITEALHGAEALEVLKRQSFDFILLDLMMPVMDGWQFRVEQRRDPSLSEIPVVVVSADASVRDRLDTMGVAGFLKKPVTFDDLMGTVRRFCDAADARA
jgi:CheY-like chemotaxis protein